MPGNSADQVMLLKWTADTKGIDQSKHALDDLEKHGKKTADDLGKSVGGGPRQALKDLSTEAGTAGGKLGSLSSLLPMGPAGAGIAVVAGLTAGIASSVMVAADFQKNLQAVGAALYDNTLSAEDNEKQLGALRKEALKVGADTSKSASEAVVAFGELAKAGISVTDIVGGAGKAVVNIAEATGQPVEKMATMFADLRSQFSMSVDQTTASMDYMARVGAATTLDISDLQAAMANVGPVAAGLGLSAEETANALGVLGQQGIKGAEGGTALRGLLLRLTAPTDAAKAALDDLGVSVFDANGKMRPLTDILGDLDTGLKDLTQEEKTGVMKTIFDSYTITAGNALISNSVTKFAELSEGVSKQATVSEQAAIRLKGMSGAMEQLKGSVETLQILLGEKFLPALTAAALVATKALNFLLSGDLLEALQNMPIVGPILDQVATAFKMIATAAEGAWDIIAGIFEGDWERVWEGVKTIVRGGVDYIQETFSNLKGYLSDVMGVAGDILGRLADGIREGLSHVPDLLEALPGLLKDGISAAAPVVLQAGQDLLAAVWDGAKAGFEAGIGILGDLLPQIPGKIADGAGAVRDAGATMIGSLWEFLSGELPTWPGRIWDFISATPEKFRDAFSKGKDFVIQQATEAFHWAEENLSAWPSKIWSFIASIPDKFCEAFKNGKTAVVNGITGAWEWLSSNVPKIPGAVGGALKNLIPAMCDIAKQGAGGFVSFLADGLAKVKEPLDWVVDRINDFVGTVNGLLEKIKVPGIPLLSKLGGGGSAPGGGFNAAAVATPAGTWDAALTSIPETNCYAMGGEIYEEQVARLGEDAARGYPEYVIPTNPSYRERALKLLTAAAARNGIDPHKMMGIGDLPNPLNILSNAAEALMGSVSDWIQKGAAKVLQEIMERLSLSFPEGLGGNVAKGVFEWVKDGVANYFQKGLDDAKKEATLGDGSVGWPISPHGVVTQGFGAAPEVYGPGGHTGVDISSGTGRGSLLAALTGQTSFTGWLDPRGTGGYGNAIILNHLNNASTLYGHSSAFTTSVGRQHNIGDQIGVEGSTGFSSGPHVHFEVRQGGIPVDPMRYLKAANGAVVNSRLLLFDPVTGKFIGEMGENGSEAIVPLGKGGTGMAGTVAVNVVSIGGRAVGKDELNVNVSSMFGKGGAGGENPFSTDKATGWTTDNSLGMIAALNGVLVAINSPAYRQIGYNMAPTNSTKPNTGYGYSFNAGGFSGQVNGVVNLGAMPGLIGTHSSYPSGNAGGYNVNTSPGTRAAIPRLADAAGLTFPNEQAFWNWLGYDSREHFEAATGPQREEAAIAQTQFNQGFNLYSHSGTNYIGPDSARVKDLYAEQGPMVLARMSDAAFEQLAQILSGPEAEHARQVRTDAIARGLGTPGEIKGTNGIANLIAGKPVGTTTGPGGGLAVSVVGVAPGATGATGATGLIDGLYVSEEQKAQVEAERNAGAVRLERAMGQLPPAADAILDASQLFDASSKANTEADALRAEADRIFAEAVAQFGEVPANVQVVVDSLRAQAESWDQTGLRLSEAAFTIQGASAEQAAAGALQVQAAQDTVQAAMVDLSNAERGDFAAENNLVSAEAQLEAANAQVEASEQALAAAQEQGDAAEIERATAQLEVDRAEQEQAQKTVEEARQIAIDAESNRQQMEAALTQTQAALTQLEAATTALENATKADAPAPGGGEPGGSGDPKPVDVNVNVNVNVTGLPSGSEVVVTKAASGTWNNRGSLFLVGEQGQELVSLDGSGVTVFPNEFTEKFLDQFGDSGLNGGSVGKDVPNKKDLMAKLKRKLVPGVFTEEQWAQLMGLSDELDQLDTSEPWNYGGPMISSFGGLEDGGHVDWLGNLSEWTTTARSGYKLPYNDGWSITDDKMALVRSFIPDIIKEYDERNWSGEVVSNTFFMPQDPALIERYQRDAFYLRRLEDTVRGRR